DMLDEAIAAYEKVGKEMKLIEYLFIPTANIVVGFF
ncbi:hypothetical protein, partial [Staphylococcus aureus]